MFLFAQSLTRIHSGNTMTLTRNTVKTFGPLDRDTMCNTTVRLASAAARSCSSHAICCPENTGACIRVCTGARVCVRMCACMGVCHNKQPICFGSNRKTAAKTTIEICPSDAHLQHSRYGSETFIGNTSGQQRKYIRIPVPGCPARDQGQRDGSSQS